MERLRWTRPPNPPPSYASLRRVPAAAAAAAAAAAVSGRPPWRRRAAVCADRRVAVAARSERNYRLGPFCASGPLVFRFSHLGNGLSLFWAICSSLSGLV